MSPTVRHDPARFELDQVTSVPEPAPVRWYAAGLLALAVSLVAVLGLTGATLPTPGLLLVLAIPLALCMNRYLFFPNEVGVTADAAVLFAAMVAFHSDGQWLGPLALAMLAGPLDARHWGARAFTRMAYNSGTTTLVTAAGLAVFVPLSDALGSEWEATLVVAALAALPYVAAESMFGITLVTLLGERPRDAARHQLPLNAIALPLAVVGAAAGLAAIGIGWCLALAVLLPCPLAPELLLVVAPRRWSRTRIVVVAAVSLVATSALLPKTTSTVAALVAFAVLAGVECRVGRARVPILGLVVAFAAPFVVPGSDRIVVIALVVVIASTTAAWMGARPQTGSDFARLPWCVPLFTAAGLCAQAWRALDEFGPPLFLAGGLAVLVIVGAWGAPPWRSRYLGAWAAAHLGSRRRTVLVLLAGAGAACMFVGVVVSAAETGALIAAALCTQATLAAAAVAVRQWRFVFRRRVAQGLAVVIAALGSASASAFIGSLPAAVLALAIASALAIGLAVALPLDRALATR